MLLLLEEREMLSTNEKKSFHFVLFFYWQRSHPENASGNAELIQSRLKSHEIVAYIEHAQKKYLPILNAPRTGEKPFTENLKINR